MKMTLTGLAYKYVVLVAMIAFVNHYAPGLNMPFSVPLTQQEVQHIGVRPPKCDQIMTLYGGGIAVSNYSFGFSDGFFSAPYSHFTGYFVITKLENDGMTSFGIPLMKPGESSNSLMERASRMKYTVNSNILRQIATKYLCNLDVDHEILERSSPLTIFDTTFHSSRGAVPSPLMLVSWGNPALRNPGSNGVAMCVSAVSGQLLELDMGNAAGCKGLPLIRNLDKLIAISDDEFTNYTGLEKSNLVSRFFGDPSIINSEAIKLGLLELNDSDSKRTRTVIPRAAANLHRTNVDN